MSFRKPFEKEAEVQSGASDGRTLVIPARPEHWEDLEQLYGERGAYAGCWCMFWRLNRADFKQLKGEGTKAVLKSLVLENLVPGVLAFCRRGSRRLVFDRSPRELRRAGKLPHPQTRR